LETSDAVTIDRRSIGIWLQAASSSRGADLASWN
jgi:hypothetical protein